MQRGQTNHCGLILALLPATALLGGGERKQDDQKDEGMSGSEHDMEMVAAGVVAMLVVAMMMVAMMMMVVVAMMMVSSVQVGRC